MTAEQRSEVARKASAKSAEVRSKKAAEKRSTSPSGATRKAVTAREAKRKKPAPKGE
jgi:hypothetical protein